MGADDDDVDTVRLIMRKVFLCDSNLQVRGTSIANCMVDIFVVQGRIEMRIRVWTSSYPSWVVPLSDLLPRTNILAE